MATRKKPGSAPAEPANAHAQQVEPLSVLNAIATEASRTLDVSVILDLALERMVALTGMEGGAVLLVDEKTRRMTLAAVHNFPQAAKDLIERDPLPVGQAIPGIAAERCQLLIVDNAKDDERELPPFRKIGIMTHVCIPLAVRGHALGVLGLIDRQPHSFSGDELSLFNAVGEQLGIALERAQLFDRQAKLNKQLEEASRHKSEFLANLSHELRTPLNAVLGASELLADGLFGPLNEKQTEYVRDIHESGAHLLSLINDVLDLSKVEAGRLDLHLSHFDLRSLMESSCAIVRERAAIKSLKFDVIPPPEDVIIEADERKVKQIVYNLLSNAVKFTPENGRVTFSAHQDSDEVIFAVEDTGPGVPEEFQERVFDEFFQHSDSEEGTGLGLTLCKRLVELHGGRIWLESQGGQGSRFSFAIPITREAATAAGSGDLGATQ
ncbi:MAG: GAF domain-containing sensor histidine kinase [Chloroflexi bacterium]|nr:GAF domain-containing sensor histidine kinase [Chloroflexota bacterium]